jgi:hypothetical protein
MILNPAVNPSNCSCKTLDIGEEEEEEYTTSSLGQT